MTKEELERLLSVDESYRIEKTVSTSDMDKFQEAICAFSNDLPGSGEKGYLLIGVSNDGKASGLRVTDDLMKKIAGIRSDGNILPLPVMNTEKVETAEGDVLVVEVTPSTATPLRYRGRVFVRIGPRKDIASAEEERILSERSSAYRATFDMTPCREASLEDIDTDFIRWKYLPQAIDPEILEADTRSLKEQMASLRLFNRKYDCPTMAAIILFGRNPRYFLPGCYVQYVRFGGKSKAADIVNEKEFRGSLFSMLPRLEAFVADSLVVQWPRPVSLLREQTLYNYPRLALRELLMNACMHRDYQSNTPIRLYQFEDRIELMNAGGLYGEARPENFPHVNAYRNPIIAESMKVMKYVNMYNRGIDRVQGYLRDNGSTPARFTVDKLTVFEVVVDEAHQVADILSPNEIRSDLVRSFGRHYESLKCLMESLLNGERLLREIQVRTKSERSPNELGPSSDRYLMKNVIRPAIELDLVARLYPDKPNHPQQKYHLTDHGKAVYELIRKAGNIEEE